MIPIVLPSTPSIAFALTLVSVVSIYQCPLEPIVGVIPFATMPVSIVPKYQLPLLPIEGVIPSFASALTPVSVSPKNQFPEDESILGVTEVSIQVEVVLS